MGQEGQTLANNGSNPFVLAALTQMGQTNAFLANNVYGQYNVAVLNLWAVGQAGTSPGKRQDQLILTGPVGRNDVPDGGLTLTLLGCSLTGLAALRRHFGRKG
jgi:hypothetical protein